MTTRAWIRWAEAQMRHERALAADRAADERRGSQADREPAVTPGRAGEPDAARLAPILVGVVAVAMALVLVLAAGVWWWGGRSDTDPTDRARAVSAAVTAPRSPVALPADGEHTR